MSLAGNLWNYLFGNGGGTVPMTGPRDDGNGGLFWPLGSEVSSVLSLKDFSSIENAYYKCGSLQTTMLDKAQCAINAITTLQTLDGKEATSSQAKAILKKMARPNYSQSYPLFRAQSKTWCQLYGWHLVWYKPNGLKGEFQNIWNLHPVKTQVTFSLNSYFDGNNMMDCIVSIKYYWYGNLIDIPKEEVRFVEDTTDTYSGATATINQHPTLPTSRFMGQNFVLSNNIAAMDSRNSMITTRGAQGFISPNQKDAASAILLLPNEIEDLERKMAGGYGIGSNQSKYWFSPKGIKYQATNMSTRELMLFDETTDTKISIAASLGWPRELLGLMEGSTYANQREAEKGAYQRTIIPEDKSEVPQLWAGWNLESLGLKVVTDFSHLEILKEDEQAFQNTAKTYIENIKAIQSMNCEYEKKIKIAVTTLQISEQEAKELISTKENEPTGSTTTTEPQA